MTERGFSRNPGAGTTPPSCGEPTRAGSGPCSPNWAARACGSPTRKIDLADPAAPAQLVATAVQRLGPLDTLVLNHARSQLGTVDALTADDLDGTWAVNVRASLLLVREFVAQYRPVPHGGSLWWPCC
jgi:NAD(P)-dependent dehydrogenase (short-subunit alcohol dehydrogenase family)